jgi:hypothetical protein
MAAVVGGLALLGLGAWFVAAGLDRADKLASVIGAFVGLLGLGISGYALVLSRGGRARSSSSGQTVARSTVGGSVVQVRGVVGDVRVGTGIARTAGEGTRSSALAKDDRPVADQLVIDSQSRRDVRQIDDVGGDLEVDA